VGSDQPSRRRNEHPDQVERPSGGVPYGKYLRFVWPLLVILAVLTIIVFSVGAFV
jgi:hypothetical protein